jgi:hypothetical protein
MTFRPYTGKVRLGNSETFLDISELSDGYVLSREGNQIVATLIDQSKLSLDTPSRDADAATKGYVDSELSSEESARIAGDAGLQSSLTSEASARVAADAALQVEIDTEESARAAGDASLSTSLGNEASTRAAAVVALQGSVAGEESARIAGDSNLQTQINNLLSNVTPESLDSLSEIVSAFQDADGYLLEVVQNLSTGSSSALGIEISARAAGDAALQAEIDTEESARAAGDAALTTSLGVETSARIAADAALQVEIDTEESARAAGDAALSTSLGNEASARAAADAALQVEIDAEESARAAGDAALSTSLGNEASARIAADAALQVEIDAEESARAAGDSALTTSLGGETSARVAADAALQVEVDAEESARAAGDAALSTSLGLETSARVAQDGYLHDLIVDEVERASGAEEALQGNIDAEASVRAAAVISLQGEIDTEESVRAAQDTVLQGNINTEASARVAADGALASDLDLEESARIAQDQNLQNSIGSEASARAAADAGLAGDLDIEESARIAGDSNLQTQINNLLSNVDPAALDSLSEIISAFQDADGYLLDVVQNLSTGSSSALGLETSARIAADAALQVEVDAEESARAAGDAALTTSLGVEASARIAADAALQVEIDAEESARAAGDAALSISLGNETSARIAADAALQIEIDTEESARAAGDAALSTSLSNETSARVAADATKLALSGGTMTGAIAMGNNKVTGLAAGTDASDAVTLSQLQSAITDIDPAGSTGQIQFNADGYDFGASANLAWDNAQSSLFVGGAAKVNGVVSLGEVAEVPAGEAGYGKLFAKSDDGLYFVDSEGVNHYVLLDGYVQLSGTSVALDASPSLPVYRSLSMTDATTFTTSNLGVGRSVTVRLVAGAAQRAVTFPAGWSWLGGAVPAAIPANKVALLSFIAYGPADTDVIAAWSYNDSEAISGGGTTGQVAFYDGIRSVSGEANLTWDAENDRLVVGTVASPAANLHVGGSAQVDGAVTMNGAVTIGDGYADVVTVNGTATFNQPVSMGSNKITNLATPSSDNDAVNLAFLESRRLLTIQTIAGSGSVNATTDVVFVTGSGSSVIRLPEAVAGNAGKVIVVKKRNSGAEDNVGTASGSGQAIDGAVADSSSNLQELMLLNESLTFISDGSNWFII